MAEFPAALIEQAARTVGEHHMSQLMSGLNDPSPFRMWWECGCGWKHGDGGTHAEHVARAVVEAVAPAIRAQALRDAAEDLRNRGTLLTVDGRIFCARRLDERADQIEKEADDA